MGGRASLHVFVVLIDGLAPFSTLIEIQKNKGVHRGGFSHIHVLEHVEEAKWTFFLGGGVQLIDLINIYNQDV